MIRMEKLKNKILNAQFYKFIILLSVELFYFESTIVKNPPSYEAQVQLDCNQFDGVKEERKSYFSFQFSSNVPREKYERLLLTTMQSLMKGWNGT